MTLYEQYRCWIRGKTRIFCAWGFLLVLFFFVREMPNWVGIGLCFLGATLRFWASGYLRKDDDLATAGPYAYVRNPLYLGTYMMAIGVLCSSHHWILWGSLSLFFAAVYHFVILDEEIKLNNLFPETYAAYCREVPRFFPRPCFSQCKQQTESFNWKVAWKNKAFEAYLVFLGFMVWMKLAEVYWQYVN